MTPLDIKPNFQVSLLCIVEYIKNSISMRLQCQIQANNSNHVQHDILQQEGTDRLVRFTQSHSLHPENYQMVSRRKHNKTVTSRHPASQQNSG